LDGRAGMAWCTLQAFYEYLILLKVWEMKNLPIPTLNLGLSDGEQTKAEAHHPVSQTAKNFDSI
ncbi:hypothetical protein PN460_04455, partial [Nodularia sphaerocarpa CS-585A2]|nr:hypothetical protein [Nodularia sphaerocarpa CS-585A2]